MPRPAGHLLRAWNKAVNILTGFSAAPRPAGEHAAARPGARIASA
jgi:hypothetical protein